IQPQTARTTSGTSPQRPFGSLQTLIYAGTSVRSPRGTGSTTSRELGFAILSSHLSSLWTWQAQGEEKLSHRLKSILAHGRAFVILTAIAGGLAVGVTDEIHVHHVNYDHSDNRWQNQHVVHSTCHQ